eukprot:3808694-Pyramimonas_sp.AAC.1
MASALRPSAQQHNGGHILVEQWSRRSTPVTIDSRGGGPRRAAYGRREGGTSNGPQKGLKWASNGPQMAPNGPQMGQFLFQWSIRSQGARKPTQEQQTLRVTFGPFWSLLVPIGAPCALQTVDFLPTFVDLATSGVDLVQIYGSESDAP